MNQTSVVDYLVVSDINAITKQEVINSLVTNLDEMDYLISKDVFLHDVLEREKKLPTYIGHEIGLPHNQSDGVKSSTVTIGRLAQPVQWTEDGDEVNTVILISVPKKNEDNLHLRILSKLARWLMHEEFRDEVRSLGEDVLIDVLNQKVKEDLE
ncbi:PTS sugar transporter subunit IIA [Halobacillus andaensis]|uniref:PTS sugar transporter subunit IIA n=1 Tax=Halobacillus andaensis TaxID=1176239 RepID=UPI003D71F3D5